MTRTRPRHASWRDLNALGAFVLEQMSDTDIVERRIETVTLMDAEHTERRVSLTIDADRLFDKATRHQTVTESNPGGLTVPFVIATPDKQLQLDMDASVAAGPIPILSSDDDARAAFAVIRQVLKRQKINLDRLSPAVQDELYSILRDEYTVERLLKIAEDTANVAPLKFSRRLSSEELRLLEWSRLLAIDELYDALVDLSQRYLLMAELPLNKPFTILKYRRIDGREHQGGWFRLAHLGLTPLKLDIPAYGIGSAGREHTRIMLPAGTAAEWATLECDGEPVAPEDYSCVRELDRVVVYTRGLRAGLYNVVLSLRPRRGDFFVPAAIAMTISTGLLWAAAWLEANYCRFSSGGANSDATVALLGLIPSLIMLYLLQRNEHQLLARFYMVPRLLVLAAIVSTWIGAGAVAIGAIHENMLLSFNVAAVVNSMVAGYFWVIIGLIGLSRTRWIRGIHERWLKRRATRLVG